MITLTDTDTANLRADQVTAGMVLGTDQTSGTPVLHVAHPAPGTVWLVTTSGLHGYQAGDQLAVLDR